MQEYMKMMGLKVKDRVTGFTGVAECISFDLYGCIQVAVKPQGLNKDGKTNDGSWFDHKRLEILDKRPVMALPNFDNATQSAVSAPKLLGRENGPADKPLGRIR